MGWLSRDRAPDWRLQALVAVAGGLALAVYVAAQHVPARDLLDLFVLAGGVMAVTAVITAVLVRHNRGASLAWQIIIVTVLPLLAVMVGTGIGAKAMFVSRHDLTVVVVLLLSAGTVGCIAALSLARRVARSSADLRASTQQLGEGVSLAAADGAPVPRELADLRHDLEEASTRLAEARERERALESSRRELIAWVSHDLRTPLAGIRAMAEALEDGVVSDPETVERYHATLRTESDRLAGLVDDLFELSQAQTAAIRFEWDRIALGDLVSDAVAVVSPVARAKGVRIEGRVDGAPPEVVGSPPELLRALRNILENAVRHTPADGTVLVEAGCREERAFVTVSDTGGGIPDEALDRVFDVGFRADPARGRDGGAGLGLAIARELVEAHRGEITVRNDEGGACFTVLLPIDAPIDAPIDLTAR